MNEPQAIHRHQVIAGRISTAFLKKYNDGVKALSDSVVKPLDAAYLAWLKSAAFKTHFTHNFDPQDFRSGQAYQVLAYSCIQDA
ncbi:MAG: hypothetical protein P8014_19985, partial [Acidihalobacter sp.]|uniref:hypothetical protein n=1 Tax=Acidihalobacter sp. TaxID=1872108 RepID=UPI00307F853D